MKYILGLILLLVTASVSYGKPLKIEDYDGKLVNCGKWENTLRAVIIRGCPGLLYGIDPLPTPEPTPFPTPEPPVVPTPKPTQGPVLCSDGRFVKVNAGYYVLKNITVQYGTPQYYCVDLPGEGSIPFFELYTINLGNASCSDLRMVVTDPSGRVWTDNGPAPGVRPFREAGRWQMKLSQDEGCNRYDFHIDY